LISRWRSWPLALGLLGAGLARADGPVDARIGVLAPGRSLATGGDAASLRVNPAGLSLMPAYELRVDWVRAPERSLLPGSGVSFDAATPLYFGLSGGVGVDWVRPSGATSVPDHRWLTGGLSLRAGQSLALGLSASRSYSDSPALDGLLGVTSGLLWMPGAGIGFAALARNWNGYVNAVGTPLDRSFELGMVLRPTGTRAVEIGLEARRPDSAEAWTPAASLGVAIPRVGRLRGDVAVSRPFQDSRAISATVGLDLVAGGTVASGGAIFGPGGGVGAYGGLALRGFRDGGLPSPRHFVKIKLAGPPGARGHVQLLRSLWRLAASPDVAGVALQLKGEPAASMAHAEELGDAIRMLRSRGKLVFCHLEDAQGRALHVCSQADRIVMNPAGGLRFAGLKAEYLYFGGLLDRLGVRAEFVRIGVHKTAAEQFTLTGPTPQADADHAELLRETEKTLIHDVGGGRKIPADELRARLARGPFVAKEARAAGLIDGYAYDDELSAVASEMAGELLPVIDSASAPEFMPRAADRVGDVERIAIVYVDGDMIDGQSRNIPLVGSRLAGSYTIAAALQQARLDPRIRSVVLRLETPGGSSLAADVIWREAALTARVKPLVVSMGSVAASAGYYIAAPGAAIYASRSTITGSIGVYYGKVDVDDLLKKLGVGVTTYRTAPRADSESMFRPFTTDEREELGRKVKQFYDTFVDRVARGRHLTAEQVDAVARGKVWTGEQALARHLVDHLGGLREAIDEAARLAQISSSSPLVELPVPPSDLLGTALSLAGLAQASEPGVEALLPADLRRAARALAPLLVHEGEVPLARLEFGLLDP
jgi:protease-4